MPSCSVHHCVLFLLTLTFTTDPGSAVCEFPITAKLHQSVTLPCEAQCSGRGWWSLDSNRTVVFARCDQTSCRSVQQGYEMSHDQYKRGDLSLTITDPDYSMRNKYTCECDYSDYATVRLRISTEFSVVQVSPGEDLKLDLSVPESVEVIYRGSDSADGVQICTVTQRSLECNTEYTPRTSVSNSALTLRDVQRNESGTYTIRNLDYKEDIRVYAVSVSGLTHVDTAVIVIGLLLLVLIAGVAIHMWRKAVQVKSDKVSVFELIKQAHSKPAGDTEAALDAVEEKINTLQQKYSGDSEHSGDVESFCDQVRLVMELWRNLSTTQIKTLDPVAAEVNRDMIAVDELIMQAPHRHAGDVKALLDDVKKKINELKDEYRPDLEYKLHVFKFCHFKNLELDLYRTLYGTRSAVTEEVRRRMAAVNDLMTQVKRCPPEKVVEAMQEVLQKTNELERDYIRSRKYSHHITNFCKIQRLELESYYTFRTAKPQEHQSLVVAVEGAVKIFEELKHEATSKRRVISSEELAEMFIRVDKYLRCINFRCSENITYLANKDLSDDMKVFMKMVDMESHVHQVQKWYEEKMMELSRYMEVLPAQAPKAPRNTDREELVPLV